MDASVYVDDSGKVVQVKHVVGSGGVRGNGYSNAIKLADTTTIKYERGHIFSCKEGALDNCIEDSPINIVVQTRGVNDPRMKAFELFRFNNCQGMDVTTDILDNGYVRVRVPDADIDVTYNPLSTTAQLDPNSGGWYADWYLRGGTWN